MKMRELDITEVDSVNGGIFINPWTVMIAYRLGTIAAPYIGQGVIAFVGGAGAALGWEVAQK
jgi:hypothetical protein